MSSAESQEPDPSQLNKSSSVWQRWGTFPFEASERYGLASLQALVREARLAYDKNDDALAEKQLRFVLTGLEKLAERDENHAVELDRLLATTHSLLGRLYVRNAREQEATTHLDTALEVLDRLPASAKAGPTSIDYGITLVLRGRFHEAVEPLQQGTEFEPYMPEPYYFLGIAFMELKRWQEALKALQQAQDLKPNDAPTHIALARIYVALDQPYNAANHDVQAGFLYIDHSRPAEALVCFERALAHEPELPEASIGVGESLRMLGRYQEAVDAFDLALALLPDAIPAYTFAQGRKGVALFGLERNEEALELLQQVLAEDDTERLIWFIKALVLRELGRLEDALRTMEITLGRWPDYPDAHAYRGVMLRELGRRDEAIEALQQAIDLDNSDEWYFAELGESLRLEERTVEALQALDQALKLNPNYSWALARKGRIVNDDGDYRNAVALLEAAIALDQNVGWYYAELAEAYRMMDNHEAEALAAAERAIELEPEDAFSHARRGEILRMMRRYDEALVALDNALRINAEYAWALAVKGRVLESLERYEEAADSVRRATTIEPETAWYWSDLGDLLRMLGRYDEALQALDQVLSLRPYDAFALTMKAAMLSALERYDEALEYIDQSLLVNSEQPYALWLKGETLWLLDRNEEALEFVERSLALEPEVGSRLATKGAVVSALGRYQEALSILDHALTLSPDYAWALGMRGKLACDVADYETGEHMLARALEYEKTNGWTYGTYGWALYNLQRHEEERASYEQYVKLTPDEFTWRHMLADSLRHLGEHERAKTLYQSVIQDAEAREKPLSRFDLWSKGWCHYRLGQFDHAARSLSAALSLESDSELMFDIALNSMQAEHYTLALREYERALKACLEQETLRQRGILSVVLRDLKEALAEAEGLQAVPEAQQALSMLKEALEQAKQEPQSAIRSPEVRA